ncbi:MAG: plastocyanin [Haloarculaceae archaeon]|jgi:plastocyanin
MERRSFLRGTGAVVTGATTMLAGCTGDGGDGGGGGQSSPPATESNTIQMVTEGGQYYFDPIGLAVEPGETVTWVIENGSHSTTAYKEGNSVAKTTRIPDGSTAWNSETLSETGASFNHTFETEGTYDYFCIPHKSLGMVGRIVVSAPGGPAEGSMPPDGAVPESGRITDEGAVAYDDFEG